MHDCRIWLNNNKQILHNLNHISLQQNHLRMGDFTKKLIMRTTLSSKKRYQIYENMSLIRSLIRLPIK